MQGERERQCILNKMDIFVKPCSHTVTVISSCDLLSSPSLLVEDLRIGGGSPGLIKVIK